MRSKSKAIVLTAPGSAALAVVRLSGPGVVEFLKRHVRRKSAGEIPKMRGVHVELVGAAKLKEQLVDRPSPPSTALGTGLPSPGGRGGDLSVVNEVIDDPVIVVGEDFVDISLHASPWIVRNVLELAEREGFEVIDSYRADAELAEGETIIEREINAYLPMARTELGIRTLLAQRELWRGDFSREQAKEMLADESLYWLLNPPKLAIVGIPNAGKSTLANQLFGQQRSIVADVPGTTRDYVSEFANIDGLPVVLLDTPGLRHTHDAIEREAIVHSADEIASADVVVLVLDRTQELEGQRELMERFPEAIVVGNKADLAAVWEMECCIAISADTGNGVGRLREAIKAIFAVDDDWKKARWWTQRQRDWLIRIAAS